MRIKFGLFWAVFGVSTVISHQKYFKTQCVIHDKKANDVMTNFMSRIFHFDIIS